jgi:hypothetical protein
VASSQWFAPSPTTLTVLTTYQCTAACKQCCFESSPDVVGRLSAEIIKERIQEATQQFPELALVVFSGGEAFLLKEDLYESVAFATSKGLHTRIVTNGSWGKSPTQAAKTAERLRLAGLKEINISTGKDHQEWVPLASVISAARALVNESITTLITIEADTEDSSVRSLIASDPTVNELLQTRLLTLQSNSWMPFHKDAEERRQAIDYASLRTGCDQVFQNAVVTPHDNLSACCGLTLEHIPEMRLGHCDGTNMGRLYRSQAEDFLKYWIRVDGPYSIIERVLGEASAELLGGVVHTCQACVLLHKNERVRKALREKYAEFVPEVMTRFQLAQSLNKKLSGAESLAKGECSETA